MPGARAATPSAIVPARFAASFAIVTARDILQVLLKEAETEEVLLRDYVMGFGWH